MDLKKHCCCCKRLLGLRFTMFLLLLVACTTWMLAPHNIVLEEDLRNATHATMVRWRQARKVEAIVEDTNPTTKPNVDVIDWQKLTATLDTLTQLTKQSHVALVNIPLSDAWRWTTPARKTVIPLPPTPQIQWTDLFPEWIDEDSQSSPQPRCPTLPVNITPATFDVVVAALPCKAPMQGWRRDVHRLHGHLAAAHVAATSAKKSTIPTLLISRCEPMHDVFPCRDYVTRRGEYRLYNANALHLSQKVALPPGSCELSVRANEDEHLTHALHAMGNGDGDDVTGDEAYVSILHSTETYVCGAIALARSIRASGSRKRLVLLVDRTVRFRNRYGLRAAGWEIRLIRRIRNPLAETGSYNEWNYSKLRLWELTDFRKVVFIDADLLVLRNLDFLFHLPEVSATGNSRFVFNSGLMVVEPSRCSFRMLMRQSRHVESYNGGDQGFLNEIFTWWHRVPRKVNYLKHFWSNDSEEYSEKTRLFGADPPELFVLHYLGIKPWLCYRDYDCNWNVANQRAFSSDVAHATWWKVHDSMPHRLQKFCWLSRAQKKQLEWDRSQAELLRFPDQHWKIKITDPRLHF